MCDRHGHARLQRHHYRNAPVFYERADATAGVLQTAGAERHIPHDRRTEIVRNIAGRIVTVPFQVVTVRDGGVGQWSGQNRRVEHRGRDVGQFRSGIRGRIRQAARQALPDAERDALVVRRPDIVSVEADGRVLRIRFQELRPRDRRIADRGRARNDAEVRIGDPLSQRGPQLELLFAQRIAVAVRDADIDDLRSEVRDFDDRVRRQLALDRDIPLLRVAGPQIAVNGEHALSEAGRWRRADRRDGWSVFQHECW